MKQNLLLILFGSFIFFIASCGTESELLTLPDPVPEQEQSSASYGITLSLSEKDYEGTPKAIEVTLQNNSEETYVYGEFYQLETQVNGVWYIVPYPDGVFFNHPAFTNLGQEIKPGEIVTQIYSPEALDLQLPPGNYRLVKTFAHEDPVYTISVAALFRVH